MSAKWTNEVIAETAVTEKVKWVLQRSTSPEGETMIGLRKFVETKNGVKPTGSGLSVKDVAEIDILIGLLQKAKVPTVEFVIKDPVDRVFVSGRDKTEIKFTKVRAKAKVFPDKVTAQAFRTKYGKPDWLVVKKNLGQS